MQNLHVLTIESKRKVSITEAKEVVSFSDREIKLKLKDGSFLTIVGEDLKITAFDDVSGNFTATGVINGSKYKQAVGNLIKKVFS